MVTYDHDSLIKKVTGCELWTSELSLYRYV